MVFFKEMCNYFLCFIFFGVWAPWQNFQYKWQLRIYLLLSIITIYCSYFITFYIHRFMPDNTLSTNIANASFLIMFIVHSIIFIETFFKTQAQQEILQKISSVDQLFSIKLGVKLLYFNEKRELFCRIAMLVFMIFSIKIPLWFYTRFLNPVLEYFYCTMYSSWIMRLRFIQTMFFVHLVRTRLILINSELKIMLNQVTTSDCLISENICNSNRLIFLKQAYETLLKIYVLVNYSFGYSLLAICTQNFIDFTSNCYWVFLLRDSPNIEALIICIVLLIPNVVTLSTLAFYCSSCTQHVSIYEETLLKSK